MTVRLGSRRIARGRMGNANLVNFVKFDCADPAIWSGENLVNFVKFGGAAQ